MISTKLNWVIAGSLVAASVVCLYVWSSHNSSQREIDSQLAAAQVKVLRDVAEYNKKAAEASDKKVEEQKIGLEQAKKLAEAEHAKSEALKKKLLAMGVQPLPGIPGGAEDTSSLKDQIITQQENEIQSLNGVIASQDEQIKRLTVSRDTWKMSSDKFEEALKMSDKQIQALEVQNRAAKWSGVMREGKGALEGGAVVFVLTLLKVI